MKPRRWPRRLASILITGMVLAGFAAESRAQLVFNITPAEGGGLATLSSSNPVLYSQVIEGFNSAASLWSEVFSDPVTVNMSIHFYALDPGVLGETSSTFLVGS